MEILIVDNSERDSAHIRRTLRRSDSKCQVSEVSDVDGALALLKQQSYDAILVEYEMSKRDGLDLLLELKTGQLENACAIVLMSKSEEETLAMECLQAGAHDFIAKSDITGYRLRRAILGAKARFEMEQKLQESYQKVKQLAERDSLTQLANRYLFDESLKQAISNNQRHEYKIALLLFDLDHFKFVNDTYGHDMGDVLLQKVVSRVHSCLRGTEVFSRLGGDEFAIVLSQLDHPESAEKVASRILRVLIKPFEIGNASLNIGASIGISIYPDDGNDASEIVKSADIAMYKAKHMGRNQLAFFEKSMQDQFLNRFKLESELAIAIRDSQFELFYQPVYGVNGVVLTGFEALIRWNKPNQQMSPEQFIPVAEEIKLIHPIGRWVIDIALSQISQWRAATDMPLSIAINLSPVQLLDKNIVQYISDQLIKHNVPASSVEFELTETALLDSSDVNLKTLNEISRLGCRIALDDFGTGYSSLSHLHQFPIDTVKIDRSLMPDKEEDDYRTRMVKGLVAMIQILDLEIVAEGVELHSQLDLCKELQIERIQGFLLSEPKSAKDIELLPEILMATSKNTKLRLVN